MEVIESPKQSEIKKSIDLIWHPHPVTPIAGRQTLLCAVNPATTVRQVLIAAGVDIHQPIVITLDDRMLTVAEWDTVYPKEGQIINVQATVMGGGGGGGGSNVLQMVALIALVVVVSYFTMGAGTAAVWGAMGTTAAEMGTAGALALAAAGAVVIAAGAAIINGVFAAKVPGIDNSGTTGVNSAASTTYSLSGGNNSTRPYESMPVVMGAMRWKPDLGAKPYVEYQGSDQYLHQIFHLGLSSLTNSAWQIATNPITDYTDYTWAYQDSTGKINAFPGNVDSAAGAVLKNSSGWVVRTTSATTYRIGIDLEGTMYYANDAGGLSNTSAQLRVQYRPVGTSTWVDPSVVIVQGSGFVSGHYSTYNVWVTSGYWDYSDESSSWVDTSHYESRTDWVSGSGGTIIVSGASQSTQRATLFIDVPEGQYDVRVIRDTADSTDSRLQNSTNWSTLRSYQTDKASYIGQNRVGLTIRASEQLNGVIQQLSVYSSAKAYYYNGSAWVFAETSNPAHWFMDFAIGRRDTAGRLLYGVGLSATQIDTAALNAWASFCSAENLTFNGVLDRNQTAADILNAIARCGFASPTWSSGKLAAVWDARNSSPVAAFGMSNIARGSFQISYITEQLAEEIIVQYTDPDKNWESNEVRVTVPGVTTPARSSTVNLFGCTNQAMAGKFANYMAAQQYYRKRRIQWETDFEGFVCQRGDVVILSHDLAQWGYSGRVVSVSGNTLTLDRSVPRSGSTDYVMLKEPDGTLTTYTVASGSGDSETLTLTSAPTFQDGTLPMDHVWFFSPLPTPGKKVKIVSVQPLSETRLQIIATDESPEFYAAWDGTWNTPGEKSLLLNSKPVVSNIKFNEQIYRGSDSAIKSKVTISWSASGTYERANVRYQIGGDAWRSATTYGDYLEIDTASTGKISVEILPIYGSQVGAVAKSDGWVYGVQLTLADVQGFADFYRDGKTVLTWRSIVDPRAIEYEVRKGETWAKGQVLGRVTGNEYVADGDGMYWVAAHTGALYSNNPSALEIIGASLVANVIAGFDEPATGWSGSLTGGAYVDMDGLTLVGTGLFSDVPQVSLIPRFEYLGGIASSGTYQISSGHEIDIGYASACNVTVSYRMRSDSPYNIVSLYPRFGAMASIAGNYAGQSDCKIQMAIAPASGVYGEWRDFIPATYYGRKFKFRAVLSSYDTTVAPYVDQFAFSIDVPDRVDTGNGIAVSSSGTSVVYSKPFQVKPNVQITIVSASSGDDAVLTSESATGFNIIVKNGSGTPVARTVNWIAQGY